MFPAPPEVDRELYQVSLLLKGSMVSFRPLSR